MRKNQEKRKNRKNKAVVYLSGMTILVLLMFSMSIASVVNSDHNSSSNLKVETETDNNMNYVSEEPCISCADCFVNTIEGTAKLCDGSNAPGINVQVTSSSGTKTTTTGSTGYWQVDVGSLTGGNWTWGSSFTVTYSGSSSGISWTGSDSGTVSSPPTCLFDCGTTFLTPSISLTATADASPTTILEGGTVSFTGSASGGYPSYSWYWDFDGDGTSTQQNPTHQFNTAGVYDCTLTVTDSCSDTDNDIVTITVNAVPPNTPSAPNGQTTGDHNTLYTYTTSTTHPGGKNVYYWFDWNDGTNSGWVGPYPSGSTGSASHTWTSPGTFNIKVKAKEPGGAESGWSPTTTVTMGNTAPPVPNTPSGETSGHHGTSYSYSTDTVTDPEGDSVQYKFDWDDGSDSGWISTPSSSHSWEAPGTYSVRVKARDDWDESGWSSPLSVNIDNRVPNNPSTPSGPTEGNKGQSYTYTTSSSDPDGDDLEYLFDWGDSSNSGWGGPSASHIWTEEGTFQVKAKCRDNWDESGWSNSISVVIYGGPQVDADGPYYANAGDSVQFEGSASEGDPPYTWHWDFGDSETSSHEDPTHTYSEPDLYVVTLTVTDSSSNQGSDSTFAYIGESGGDPTPNANGPYTGYIGEDIQFTGTVISGTSPYTWHWDFGDGNSSTEQNPVHAYNAEGTYTVVLTVEDSEEKTGTNTTTATITEFVGEPDLECDGSLNWADIKTGTTVTGSFTVSNAGDPETLLNWEISEYPGWGTWTFTPDNGTGLTPEDGDVTIEVSVIAPDDKKTEFSGTVVVENTEDSWDDCEISVSLITPKNRVIDMYQQFLTFLQNHPNILPLIRQILVQ